MYVPAVLVEGVIAPVVPFMDKPAAELNVPPVVPDSVTDCGAANDLQNGLVA